MDGELGGWMGGWRCQEDGWEEGVGSTELGAWHWERAWQDGVGRMDCRMDCRIDGRAVGWQSLMTVVGDDGSWRGGCWARRLLSRKASHRVG
jgi:hypothetical protein